MLDRLNARYSTFNANGIRYTRAEHVKITSGFDAKRICDYMAMDLWGGLGTGGGPKLHGHEVKVSRSDWLNELKDPSKAESFARYCDYWWLVVADKAIVKAGELPPGWGLMVAYGTGLRATVSAERRDPEPMPRTLQATYARAVTKTTIRLGRADRAIAHLASRMNIPEDHA